METLITQKEAAAILRLSVRTLERHRVAGTGPAFVKLGGRVAYRSSDLMAWAASNTFYSTAAMNEEARHDRR